MPFVADDREQSHCANEASVRGCVSWSGWLTLLNVNSVRRWSGRAKPLVFRAYDGAQAECDQQLNDFPLHRDFILLAGNAIINFIHGTEACDPLDYCSLCSSGRE